MSPTEFIESIKLSQFLWIKASQPNYEIKPPHLASLTLARLHLATKNYKEALKEYMKAEEIYHKVLTNFYITEMAELYNDLVILGIEINDRGLAKKYLGLLVDKFGYSHPHTIKLLKYLETKK